MILNVCLGFHRTRQIYSLESSSSPVMMQSSTDQGTLEWEMVQNWHMLADIISTFITLNIVHLSPKIKSHRAVGVVHSDGKKANRFCRWAETERKMSKWHQLVLFNYDSIKVRRWQTNKCRKHKNNQYMYWGNLLDRLRSIKTFNGALPRYYSHNE